MPPKRVKTSPLNVEKFNTMFKGYKPNENIEIQPSAWVLPNRAKFLQWIAETFDYSKIPTNNKIFESQRFVKDYMQIDSPYRGILLYHGLGTGKSQASILAAENLIGHKGVVIILPASLRPNYIEEIKAATQFFCTEHNWVYRSWEADDIENNSELTEMICDNLFITEKIIKKNKGIWIPQPQTRERPNKNVKNVEKPSETEVKKRAKEKELFDSENPNHYTLKNKTQRAQIDAQINVMIEKKYTFINYNGHSLAKLDAMKASKTKNNDLDNKVIIVDEVHNLISGTVGSGARGKKIYDLVMTAKNAKLIVLSGTPIINHPFELAVLMNLLRGPIEYFEFSKIKEFDPVTLSNYLDKHPYVDTYDIEKEKSKLIVQLLPPTYVFSNKDKSIIKKDTSNNYVDDIIAGIRKDLKSVFNRKVTYMYPFKVVSEHQEGLSKSDELKEAFNHYFIDFGSEVVKNQNMLMRRMLGCISYYGISANSKEYPTRILPDKVIELEMSDDMFGIYRANRETERKKEERSKKQGSKQKAGNDNILNSSGQIYRAYSRANCNFVFPEGMKRPYPEKIGFLYKETEGEDEAETGIDDDNEEKINKSDAAAHKKYNEDIKKALSALAEHEAKYLEKDKLFKYSPKFHAIINTLNDPKNENMKSLAYSQFRTVEGLGVLSLALEANGWAEFKIKRKGTSGWELDMEPEDLKKPTYFQYRGDQDETKVLVNIYNNDLHLVDENITQALTHASDNKHGKMIKLIMITQSGAEGISLKHVRHVHIIEPYWNEIRIEQVIGRAIRAKSHLDLPENERNVQVFRYIMKMTKKQIDEDETLKNKDLIYGMENGKKVKVPATTDEYILDIAFRKAKIINKVQELMKKASVNCLVHTKNHPGLKCMGFPQNMNPNEIIYNLDYDQDETDFEYRQKVKEEVVSVCKKCVIDKIPYAYNEENKKIYDLEAYKNGRLKQVGHLQLIDKATQRYRLVLLEKK